MSGLSIASLILELAALYGGATVRDFGSPTPESTSLAVSWISLATLLLVATLRPWSSALHNYCARFGACMIVWICSATMLLTVILHGPHEMRVLGMWHGSVLAILLVVLLEGMLRVALANRRRPARAQIVHIR